MASDLDLADSWMPMPKAWDDCWPGLLRLAGFGGAALFLRAVVLPVEAAPAEGSSDAAVSRLAVDVGLLSPQSYARYLARPVGTGFTERLADWFLACANDQHPEVTVPSFQDVPSGLEFSVVSSSETRIGVLVRIVEDQETTVPEFDGIDFETSRAAVAQAGVDARDLPDADRSWEPKVWFDPDGGFDDEVGE